MDHLVEQFSVGEQSDMGLLAALLDQDGPNYIGTKPSEAFYPPLWPRGGVCVLSDRLRLWTPEHGLTCYPMTTRKSPGSLSSS